MKISQSARLNHPRSILQTAVCFIPSSALKPAVIWKGIQRSGPRGRDLSLSRLFSGWGSGERIAISGRPMRELNWDLLVVRGRERLGFEVKLTSSPRVTPSMRSALSDLKLQRLYVIHSGEESFQLEKNIQALALSRLLEDIR